MYFGDETNIMSKNARRSRIRAGHLPTLKKILADGSIIIVRIRSVLHLPSDAADKFLKHNCGTAGNQLGVEVC